METTQLDRLSGEADDSESPPDSSLGSPPSPSSDDSSSPPSPESPPSSTPSEPPPESSGSDSRPPSPFQSPSPPSPSESPWPPSPSESPSPPSPSESPSPPSPSKSPSPPTPSLWPPAPAAPQGSGGSPPAPALARGSPASPSRATPSAPALKPGDSSPSENRGGSSSDEGSSAVGPIVAGLVLGVVAFGLLMALVACVCCARRKTKKKRTPHLSMPYYTDEHGNVFFANSMAKWQQPNSGSAMDGHIGGGWHASLSPASGQSSGSHGPPLPPPSPGMPALGFSKSAFTYEELASATGGFAAANLLGQGGFGYVYRGVLPGSGTEVAVKRLKAGSGQGEREFQAEVEIISRVHHRHLVSLVGYCIAGSSQRLLVYEFVPNDTLEHHLHGKGVPVMDWARRLTIALGSAKGLGYLHEDCHPRIIHRDIKAANILLDENFEAKVADFGLAKLTTDTNTHVSTRVMGTFGYLAPEYASSGKLTDKSDVFSFGVMLLELITGKRPVDPTNYMEDSLVDWARPLLARALSEDGSFDELLDPRLDNKVDRLELERMAACAAAAVRHSAKRRPKMKQIVRALEGDASLDDLSEGVRPGQSMMYASSSEHDAAAGSYASHMSKIRKVAFDSNDSSSEYGLNPSQSSADSGEPPRRQHR